MVLDSTSTHHILSELGSLKQIENQNSLITVYSNNVRVGKSDLRKFWEKAQTQLGSYFSSWYGNKESLDNHSFSDKLINWLPSESTSLKQLPELIFNVTGCVEEKFTEFLPQELQNALDGLTILQANPALTQEDISAIDDAQFALEMIHTVTCIHYRTNQELLPSLHELLKGLQKLSAELNVNLEDKDYYKPENILHQIGQIEYFQSLNPTEFSFTEIVGAIEGLVNIKIEQPENNIIFSQAIEKLHHIKKQIALL